LSLTFIALELVFKMSVSNRRCSLKLRRIAMSNGPAFERASRLLFKTGMMIMDGKRNPSDVADVLQEHVIDLPQDQSILEWIWYLRLPATTEKFVARERFVVNETDPSRVMISRMSMSFRELFLGIVEEPKQESTLNYGRIRDFAKDPKVLEFLGDKAGTSLTEMFFFMERMFDKPCRNSRYYFFYIPDVNGVLRKVSLYPYPKFGWNIEVYDLNSTGLGKEDRVVCREMEFERVP